MEGQPYPSHGSCVANNSQRPASVVNGKWSIGIYFSTPLCYVASPTNIAGWGSCTLILCANCIANLNVSSLHNSAISIACVVSIDGLGHDYLGQISIT